MNERVYCPEKREILKSLFINLSIVFAIIMIVLGKHLSSLDQTIIILSVLFFLLFLTALLTSSPTLRVTKIILDQDSIIIESYFGLDRYEIKWNEIELAILGDVEIKSGRYNRIVFGFEFRGSKITHKFKISHIKLKSQLIIDILNYCHNNNIDFKDLRKKNN